MMKNNLCIIFMAFLIMQSYSLLNASMNTKDKIEKIKAGHAKAIQKHTQSCWTCQQCSLIGQRRICDSRNNITDKFFQHTAELALSAHDLNNLEKLDYLYASKYFEQRKIIIKKMILRGTHPDSIIYHVDNTTPMKEAVLFKDDTFKAFLIEQGATENK